jgi:hypothetical protein
MAAPGSQSARVATDNALDAAGGRRERSIPAGYRAVGGTSEGSRRLQQHAADVPQ